MFKPQQEQEENKDEKKAEDKCSIEQSMNAQSVETQIAQVNVSVDANVNIATDDSQKDKIDENKEEEALVKEQTVENLPLVKDTTDEEKTKKYKEDKK